jgi:uncharacterized protein (TIGR03437 family)
MMRLLFWLLACGVLGAEARLNEYALILADPPVARQAASRQGLEAQAARGPRARILAAQERLSEELARRGVRVTGAAQTLVNAVFVRASNDRVAELKALAGVQRVQYLAPVHRKLTTALDLAHASTAWSAVGGGQNAGKGVKIGILDTGIDQNHPAFQDSALAVPAGFPKGDANYTNRKVIVARSYVAMLPFAIVDPTDSRPDDATPRDHSGHGTAMAMIAAGESVAAPLGTISGIAPKAFLGNYKIFGSPGVNDTTRTPVIIQALEDAISDGMDIVALPVGDAAVYGPDDFDPACAGTSPGLKIPSNSCDVRAQAVENAVGLGLTVVVPAGNEGGTALNFPALASVDTPGTAPAAITVGATTNAHVLYSGVIVPGKDAPTRLIHALFGDGPKPAKPLSATLGDVSQLQNDGRACTALPANSLAGRIALVQRGDCAFLVKVTNAANAGALAVVIVQSAGNALPFTPVGLNLTGIPAVMVGNTDGAVLQNVARTNASQKVTLDTGVYAVDAAPDVVAAISSRGPAIGTGGIKPELLAPGADLYTAAQSYDPNGDVYNASGYAAVSGTSFAAGLAAGAAALVKQAHPGYTPAQIKSALVNSASSQVLDNGASASITAMGAGKLDAAAAVNAPATVEPATLSFGVLGGTGALPSVPLTLTNPGKSAFRFDVEVRPTTVNSLTRVTVAPGTGLLGPGQQTRLVAQLQGGVPGPGSYEGFVLIHVGSATLSVPFLYLVGDGIPDNVLPLAGASFTGAVNGQGFLVALKVIDRYGVAVTGESVQFNVAVGDGVITAADAATDRLGIAAAIVDLGTQPGDQIFTADVGGAQVEFDGYANPAPTINAGQVWNAGSHQAGKGLAPGSYIEIHGTGLGPAPYAFFTPYLPVALAGVSVSFDAPGLSVPGHLHYVSPGQINVQIPWEFQGLASVKMKVSVGGDQSAVYTLPLVDASPAAFEIPDSSGNRVVLAARDRNGKIISSANPALRGKTVTLYVNGLGPVDHTPPNGDVTPLPPPLAATKLNPTVTIGGKAAQVSFAGLTPSVVGLYFINVVVPAQAPVGMQPVVITINGIDSKSSNLPIN